MSVVRYKPYLDTYRRYLGDDNSIAKITIYHSKNIARQRKYRASMILCSSNHSTTLTTANCSADKCNDVGGCTDDKLIGRRCGCQSPFVTALSFFIFPLVSVVVHRKFCYHRACRVALIPTVADVSSFYVVFTCSTSLNFYHFDV